MVMHSNQSGAVQWRGNHSIFNEKPVKESVMGITKNVRTNALRTVWILFTFTPMVMLYNAARADEPVVTQRVSFKDLNINSPEGAAVLYGRIKKAATDVCGQWDSFDLSQLHTLQTCISSA